MSPIPLNALSTAQWRLAVNSNLQLRGNHVRVGGRNTLQYTPFGIATTIAGRQWHYANKKVLTATGFTGLGRLKAALSALEDSTLPMMNVPGFRIALRVTMVELSNPSLGDRPFMDHANDRFFHGQSSEGIRPGRANGPSTIGPSVWNPLIGITPEGFRVVDSATIIRGNRPRDVFIKELRQSTLRALPEGGASNSDNPTRIFGIFFVLTPPRARAQRNVGSAHMPHLKSNPIFQSLVSSRAVFVPETYSHCILHCLAYALDEVDRLSIVKNIKEPLKVKSANKRAKVLYKEYNGRYGSVTPDVAIQLFQEKGLNLTVVDTNGGVIGGHQYDLVQASPHHQRAMIVLVAGHYCYVRSYTALCFIKTCYRCDAKFVAPENLRKHLISNICLTCPCKLSKNSFRRKRPPPFESEQEWAYHKADLSKYCPLQQKVDIREVEMKIGQERFVLPRPRSWLHRRADIPNVDNFIAPWVEEPIVIYFDLESISPVNVGEVDRLNMDFQRPYAAGWITSQELKEGKPVHLAYGTDCIQEFISWLDNMHDVMFASCIEKVVAITYDSLEADPTPRRIGTHDNRAKKVKRAWGYWLENCRDYLEMDAHCNQCHTIFQTAEEAEEHWKKFSCSVPQYAEQWVSLEFSRNMGKMVPRVTIYAHNGGRYDWVLLWGDFMRRARGNQISAIRSRSKIFRLTYRHLFIFRDTALFMGGSLEALGKSFGVENLKGIFPYQLVSSENVVYEVIKGEEECRARIPATLFQLTESLPGPLGACSRRPYSEFEYMSAFEDKEWIFDVKKETLAYLTDDVLCLAQVWEKFRQGWLQLPHSPDPCEYDTIGQLSHTYFLKHYANRDAYMRMSSGEDDYIRQALYGGRTEVFTRYLETPEPVHYVDVNSLYPYVMETYDLPSGEPFWYLPEGHEQLEKIRQAHTFNPKVVVSSESDLEMLKDAINRCSDRVYGFVEVEVSCPQHLRLPVLPERRVGSGGTTKNFFCLRAKRGIYYSEELKYAVKRGYTITKVLSYCNFQKHAHYREVIRSLKSMKMRADCKDLEGKTIPGLKKNPAVRTASKLGQNSMFGKTIQNIQESSTIVHSQDELWELLEKEGVSSTVVPLMRMEATDIVEVVTKYPGGRTNKRSCSPIGTAILAHARMVLYDYFEAAEKVGGRVLYCDTDSIVFAGQRPLESCHMHPVLYGKMSDEIPKESDGIVPGGFVALSPKCYAFKLESGHPYVKCKGVSVGQNLDDEETALQLLMELMESEDVSGGSSSQRGISYDKLRSLVTGAAEEEVFSLITEQTQFVKTKDFNIAVVKMEKRIRDTFDKRKCLPGGDTRAWNDLDE